MKQEEEQVLFREKVNEGKTEREAFDEIETLKQSQIKFKVQEKELKHLRNRVEKLEKQNNDLKNKLLVKNLQPKVEQKIELKLNGNFLILKRMIRNMDKSKFYSIKELSKEMCCGAESIKASLIILKELNLINETNKNTIKLYQLK